MSGEDWPEFDPFTAAALGHLPADMSVENINNRNMDGWTMLMYACYFNKVEVVSFLVDKGADKTLQCNKGRTALMIACINGNIDILKIVFKGDIMNLADFNGVTPLGVAIEYGHVGIAEFLLSKGADPNMYLESGTCLLSASASGHYPIVELLLRHGADTTITNHQGKTARALASGNGYMEIANLIRTFEEASIESTLNFLGLEEYLTLFKKCDMSFKTFLNMTEDDMRELGITIFGRRRKLAMYLKEAKACYDGLL